LLTNEDIADALERVGDLLEVQDSNPFRVRAYRDAAETVRGLPTPLSRMLSEGSVSALRELPGIGEALARAIQELIRTGRLALLDRLEGQICPEDLFQTVPGIGEELARRIHRDLHVETLEDLELAAHDGTLEHVPGFGPRRVRGVRESLAAMLGRSTRRRAHGRSDREPARVAHAADARPDRPPVAMLLEIDDEYRRRAEAGALTRIAPRRFNPSGEAWLPIMHSDRQGWYLTALYSNTARAHELGRTHDWVVIYADGHDGTEQRYTVVTEYRGELDGRRVVRGREDECRAYYQGAKGSA
jgi:DNA polymerase (family 10)